MEPTGCSLASVVVGFDHLFSTSDYTHCDCFRTVTANNSRCKINKVEVCLILPTSSGFSVVGNHEMWCNGSSVQKIDLLN